MTVPSLAIDEALIRRHATAKSFERGQQYFRRGAVVSLIQRGQVLVGEVEGSDYAPYRTTLWLDEGGLRGVDCTCPYDFGGWCKHLVATLLATLHTPGKIEQRPSLTDLLAPCDRTQLLELVQTLVAQQPTLIDCVEQHLQESSAPASIADDAFAEKESGAQVPPSQASPRRTAVDPEPFRRQVQTLLRGTDSWDDSPALDAISELVAKAEKFTIQGDGWNALRILAAITDAYVSSWMNLDGSSGDSGFFFEELDAAIAEAMLTTELSAAEQQDWQAKLTYWLGEAEQYGVDNAFAQSETALAHGWHHPQLVAVLQGQAMTFSEETSLTVFVSKTLPRIRLDILERQQRYDEYLKLAPAMGQSQAYLSMLAQQGQVETVLQLAPQQLTSTDEALPIAQTLRSQGHLNQALNIAELGLTLPGHGKAQLAHWVSELAAGLGQANLSLKARMTAFQAAPSLRDYLAIQQSVEPAQWPEYRDSLLQTLRQPGNGFASDAQVDIFLHEGLWAEAIKTVDGLRSFQSPLIQRVMDAVTAHAPDWVIENARRRAESIMNEGKARYYAEAVTWLGKAHRAYQQAERQSEWQAYYADLLRIHGRKRKLMGMLSRLK